jgi:hypothetical protein
MVKMLLRDVTIPELAGIFEKHKEQSPAPCGKKKWYLGRFDEKFGR